MPVRTLPQPDETTCGPTCLHAMYNYWGKTEPLKSIIVRTRKLESGSGTFAVFLGCLTLPAFSGYGIELEYMIVDRRTLSILPIAEKVLQRISETCASGLRRGELAWSHELVLHLIELKNVEPDNDIDALAAGFQSEIRRINYLLEPMGARLMPAAMHPWMNPRIETRIWLKP